MNPTQHGLPMLHLPSSGQSTTHSSSSSFEKPYKSFFKRPINTRREKKAPPPPLVVLPAPSPQFTRVPSSPNATSKFNSLLTAAARSIRTGDSRLFESFQAALSPKPLQSQLSTPHPPPPKNNNPNSLLKRIPVPSYNPLQVYPPKPELFTRASSLERPRTATKHSRTTSLPYSHVSPTLELGPTSSLTSRPPLDLAESVENLSDSQQKLVHLVNRLPPPFPIHTNSAPNLQSHLRSTQSSSNLPPASPSFHSASSDTGFPTHPHKSNSGTTPNTHRIDFNLSLDQSCETGSKALLNSVGDRQPQTPSISPLLQLDSQHSLPLTLRSSSLNYLSSLYSSTGSSVRLNSKSNDFLEPETKTLSAREDQRKSFANMPLPALPHLFLSAQLVPSKNPILELQTLLSFRNQHTAGFQIILKRKRPWSTDSRAICNVYDDWGKSQSIDGPSDQKRGILIRASTSPTSPPKLSKLVRQNRHSYPPPSFLDLSSLESLSDQLLSDHSTSQIIRKSQLKPPIPGAGPITQCENDALRLTPSITPSRGNLMFGFRGEVYELDNKFKKSNVQDHSINDLIDLDNRDSQALSSQPSSYSKLSQTFVDQTVQSCDLFKNPDGSSNRSSSACRKLPDEISMNSKSLIPHSHHKPNVAHDLFIKAQPEFEEPIEIIELNEICLIGNDHLDRTRASSVHLKPAREPAQKLVIRASSPRNSEINSSTEIVLENLSVDRGSSEEESLRLSEESIKLQSGPEPKIINPETSLEMAASILGQPVPSISKEIREGFERIHYLFSDERTKESVEKDKQEFISKMLKTIDHKIGASLKTSDAATQTDPVEFGIARNNSNPTIVQVSSMLIPKTSNRRMADTLKKWANRTEISDHSKENLPLNLMRYSIQSENGYTSTNRSYGGVGAKEDQQESLRTSAGLVIRSPRFDYTTDRTSLMKQRLSGMSDSNHRFSTTWTSHSNHISQQSSQHSPLKKNSGESHLMFQSNSSTLNDSVLDALDKALRAEASFQREKQHLQAVARRQSQTIESLLIDKEVLSLEVSRLTGLVELLARDHNLLNDRIDKAEQAFDKCPTCSNGMSAHRSQLADKTVNYFTAGNRERMMILADNHDMKENYDGLKNDSRKRIKGGNMTETDDGIMGGDSEDGEDGESLCDPEQSLINLNHERLSFEFVIESSRDNLEPLPGSYPLITPTKTEG